MEHKLFQSRNEKAGFDIVEGDSAIVPVMLMMLNCHKLWLMNC
jgi:hypothetical protein